MTLPTASLYFSDGKSDKVYQAQVVARDGGYVVNFQFGRRGRALQSGSKTASPVALADAQAIFDKLVQEKTSKGYSPSETGTAFQDTDKAGRVTGVLPQLLNPVDDDGLEACLRDDGWMAQHKLDGERRLVRREGGISTGINRLGLEVPLPQPVAEAVLALTLDGRAVDFIVDGEIIDNRLCVFDLLRLDGVDLAPEPASGRLARLHTLVSTRPDIHADAVSLVRTADTEAAKRALLEDLRSHGQEGIVFKRVDAPYAHGRPNRGGNQLKFKFIESATLQVASVNGAKRSVELQGHDASGTAVPLGSVTIPSNAAIPGAGAIVEVRYLYAYPGGSLFQPVYRGERTDQTAEACVLSQLKYKAAHKEGGAQADAAPSAATTPAPAEPGDPAPAAPSTPASGTGISWPEDGFQWTEAFASDLPVLRGLRPAPASPGLALLDDPIEVDDDPYQHAGQALTANAAALGRSWTRWGVEESRPRLGREALSPRDPERWLEAMAQLGCSHRQPGRMRWLTRVGSMLHGTAFILEVALTYWDAVHGLDTPTLATSVLEELRWIVAAEGADAGDIDAAQAVAAVWRTRSLAMRHACSAVFPHIEAWAVDCVEAGPLPCASVIRESAMPPEAAIRHLRQDTSVHVPGLRRMLLLQIALHGEAAVGLLAHVLDLAADKHARLCTLELLMALRVPSMVRVLVDGLETREVREALEPLILDHPAAVLKTAIERAASTRSRATEGWAVRLALSRPAVLPTVLASLDPAVRLRFESVLAALQREDAPADALPELLRQPPWLRPDRPQALPTLDVATLPSPDRIDWPDTHQDRYAAVKPRFWFHGSNPEQWPEERLVLDTMGFIAESHARVLAGGPLQAGDIPRADHHGRISPGLAAMLPPAASLAVWNAYPAAYWAGGDPRSVIYVRCLLARHGTAALPGLAAFVDSHPLTGLEVAHDVDSPSLVPAVLRALRLLKKARPAAIRWMRTHPATVLKSALPRAFGASAATRDHAQFALRWMAQNGFEAEARDTAAAFGGAMPAALQALLDADPLLVLPAKVPKLPSFFVPAACRRPELPDGRALPVDALTHIATMLAISEPGEPYAGLRVVRELCTPASLGEFAWDLFEAWMAAGAPSKESWAFQGLGLLGDDETARRLAPKVREWPGESAHQRAVTGLDLLAVIGSDVALMHLDGIAAKSKFKALQERAKEKIQVVADARGLTAEELADRLVPDLGLDGAGTTVLDFGPRHFVVGFDEALKPFVRDSQGARLKDLPKPIKSDDAALATAASERYRQMKKDAKAIGGLQVARLESAMVSRRRWPATDFRAFFLAHPLMRHLAARLVWGAYAEGRLAQAFRIAEDGTLADGQDSLIDLPVDAEVGIAHLLEMPQALRDAFGQVFADYEILQPFKQLGRETHALTAAEQASHEVTRFKDKVVATASLMGLTTRGWERDEAQDAGWVSGFHKRLGDGLQADLRLEPGLLVGDLAFEASQTLPSLTLKVAGTWDTPGQRAFGTLDPILASELLRDIDLLAPLTPSA